MKLTKTIAALLVCAAFSISATAKSDTTDLEIRATIDDMEQALNDSNIQDLKAMYTDNAIVIPDKAKVLDDKHAIVSFWNNQFSAAKSRYHINVIHYRVNDNVAHLSALWSATVITHDIQSEVKYGYLTNVMQRQQDGSWKILEQSWN